MSDPYRPAEASAIWTELRRAALDGLARAGAMGPETVVRALDRYGWHR
jgi:hypothetical protein